MNVSTMYAYTTSDLDALEAMAPRLIRQIGPTDPGAYVVVTWPKPPSDPAWHKRQAELYRDGAAMADNAKDREYLSTLADLHAARGGR